MGCVYEVLEVDDGASPHPYQCPICRGAILAPPRRDTKSEQLVCWLQLSQEDEIDTPEEIPLDVFNEYFEERRYISEEV